jgi:hypothetical protein
MSSGSGTTPGGLRRRAAKSYCARSDSPPTRTHLLLYLTPTAHSGAQLSFVTRDVFIALMQSGPLLSLKVLQVLAAQVQQPSEVLERSIEEENANFLQPRYRSNQTR